MNATRIAMADTLMVNAGQLLTCDPALDGVGLIPDGVVAADGGLVVWAGPRADLEQSVSLRPGASVYDADGRVVLPGLVECHSHPVFGGSRAAEFQLRAAGRSYEEIAAAGGGIMSTVRATRAASDDELYAAGRRHLDAMLDYGLTTVEAKSGYGLTVRDEIRLLEVIGRLGREHAVTVVPTFLGAHTVPIEDRGDPDRYVDLVVGEMLPQVAEDGLARFCDVFCEEVAFTREQARRVLDAAAGHGLGLKLHVDQLTAGGGAQLAAELGAVSADHLDHIDADGIAALAEAGVTAVLLPGAVFFLGLQHYAPARALIEAGVTVALSTDFNPGTSYTENPYLIGTIASTYMGMSASEVVLGLTRHAAQALGMADEIGSLAPGRRADLVVADTADYLTLPYHFGVNPVRAVFKAGRPVRGADSLSTSTEPGA